MAKIAFDTPTTVRLRSIEGKPVESQFGGDQRQFACEEGVFWLNDEAGSLLTQRLRALGIQPGEPVTIAKVMTASPNSKRKHAEYIPGRETDERDRRSNNGSSPNAEVISRQNGGSSSVPRGPVGATPRVPASKFADKLEEQLQASLHQAELRKKMARAAAAEPQAAPETLPAWATSLANQSCVLVDVFASVLRHAGRHGNQVRPEDVRALMTTAFINLAQKGGYRTA